MTSAAWRDIWLNEGFTTYVQGRIPEAVYGKTLADEEALLSARDLQKHIGEMPENSQKLAPEPHGVDADDTLSDVAYTKGSWFLRTLEQRFGRSTFDAYLKGYFAHFAFQSIDTEQMLEYLKAHLFDQNPGKMDWAEVKEWVYEPGIPKNAPLPVSPRFDAIDKERAGFLAGSLAADKLDARGWNTQEWMYFLDGMPDVAPLEKMQQLDAAWHLTGTPNAEIGMQAMQDGRVTPGAGAPGARIDGVGRGKTQPGRGFRSTGRITARPGGPHLEAFEVRSAQGAQPSAGRGRPNHSSSLPSRRSSSSVSRAKLASISAAASWWLSPISSITTSRNFSLRTTRSSPSTKLMPLLGFACGSPQPAPAPLSLNTVVYPRYRRPQTIANPD